MAAEAGGPTEEPQPAPLGEEAGETAAELALTVVTMPGTSRSVVAVSATCVVPVSCARAPSAHNVREIAATGNRTRFILPFLPSLPFSGI